MSNAQAERAISQLYESDSLRSELRDEEASLLLSWGEVRLSELAKRDLPDTQFDHLSAQFRSLMAAINVCVGKRKTSPSQHLPMMASISSAAEAAGYTLTPDDQTAFLQQQSAMTNQDAISELLGLLKPAAIPQAPPSQNIGEAVAEIVTPEPPPEIVDNSTQPPSQNIGETIPEIITPQAAPEIVDNSQPPQPEELPELPPLPPQPPQEG
jgi:hypothetical protein